MFILQYFLIACILLVVWTGGQLQRWVSSVLFDGVHYSGVPRWIPFTDAWDIVGCLPAASGG